MAGKRRRRSAIRTSSMFFVICVLVWGVFYYKEQSAQKIIDNGTEVTAEVFDIEEKAGQSEQDGEYKVRIKWTYKGETYADVYRTYSTSPSLKVGDKLQIMVDQSDPETWCSLDGSGALRVKIAGKFVLVSAILFGISIIQIIINKIKDLREE